MSSLSAASALHYSNVNVADSLDDLTADAFPQCVVCQFSLTITVINNIQVKFLLLTDFLKGKAFTFTE